MFLQSGESWAAAFILAQSESFTEPFSEGGESCWFWTSYRCCFRISWPSVKQCPLILPQRKHLRNNNGRQTQEAEPEGVSPSTPSSPYQPPQALRPACQQKCHLLSRPAAASLPQEQRQVQKVHRSTRAAQRGVHSRRSSTKDHQVCVLK